MKQNWRFCCLGILRSTVNIFHFVRFHSRSYKVKKYLHISNKDGLHISHCRVNEQVQIQLNSDTINRIQVTANSIARMTPTVNRPLKKPRIELLFLSVLSIILNTVHRMTRRSSIQPRAGTKSGITSTGLAKYRPSSNNIARLPALNLPNERASIF